MTYQWQFYCPIVSDFFVEWGDVEPTTCLCPLAHPINSMNMSISFVTRPTYTILTTTTTNSSTFTNLGSFFLRRASEYDGNDGIVKYLKLVTFVDSGSYDIQVSDTSGTVLLSSSGLTNTTVDTISFDLETVTLPTTDTIYNLEARTSGGTLTICTAVIFRSYSK